MRKRQIHLLVKLLIKEIHTTNEYIDIYFTDLGLELMPLHLRNDLQSHPAKENIKILSLKMPYYRKKGSLKISIPDDMEEAIPERTLVHVIAKAFQWDKKLGESNLSIRELGKREGIDAGYMGRVIKLRYLSPDIIESIISGKFPKNFTQKDLLRGDIPCSWTEQRKKFGFKNYNPA